MGKGSSRRPLLISEQEAQDNWDKIFSKTKKVIEEHNELFEMLKQSEEQDKKNIDPITKPFPHNILKQPRGDHYEYELNKSTGDVEKRFTDGTSKPNESQFDGN